MKSIIFTDGASRGNPGNGGWGAIIAQSDDNFKFQNPNFKVREIGGKEENTTNNRMELTAVIEALKFAESSDGIELYTDSAYLINGITKWVYSWRENDWQTKTKKEVLNVDLWQDLLDVSQDKKISWHRISGHSGVPANERCDVIATSFADAKPIQLFYGPVNKYKINLSLIEGSEKAIRLKSNKKTIAYSYVSQVDGKIEIHKTWAECETRVKRVSGARFKKSTSEADEADIIAEFSQVR